MIFSFAIAVVPIGIICWRSEVHSTKAKNDSVAVYRTYADSLIDLVERNLFDRYGDVQAFASNEILLNQNQW